MPECQNSASNFQSDDTLFDTLFWEANQLEPSWVSGWNPENRRWNLTATTCYNPAGI